MDKVRRLKEAGIMMNGQIVLCRGVNDGEELDRSIRDLVTLMPELQSVSVVPVGLTRYRDGLYPLEPFTKEDACKGLDPQLAGKTAKGIWNTFYSCGR